MLEGSRSIVNRRLLCVSRIEHTIECSNYTLLAKGRASEFYTIFDNETSLPPSETPSPRPGIAIDVRIQSMAIMSSPFLRYKRIILSESIRSDPLFHRFRGKTKDLARPEKLKREREVCRWGLAFCKPREDWRTLQHVDIIVRTCHAEERMPYPKIL